MNALRSAFVAGVVFLSLASHISMASPKPSDPKKQTPWHLYVDAKEAYQMKIEKSDQVLFVDVRDPIEIMFTGFTDVVDINIPFKKSNRDKWNPKKQKFNMENNPNFEQEISEALKTRGLDKSAPIILICRSGGTRGAPSAKALWNKGYKRVYVVTDGFEGGKVKQGKEKHWRRVNGWKNSGLPWSYKLNKDKLYSAKAES